MRYLERVPLGTKYSSSDANEDSVTRRVKKILLSETLNDNAQKGIAPPIEPVAQVLDYTGVGSPISELFELPRLLTGPGPQYKLVKINITGGLNPPGPRMVTMCPNAILVFHCSESFSREIEDLRQARSGSYLPRRTPKLQVKISDYGKDTYGEPSVKESTTI